MTIELRERLVSTALEWQRRFGVAPSITSAISEYDAAVLVGVPMNKLAEAIGDASAVRKGFDFVWEGKRYQVKANRPSGRRGSTVTKCAKASNYDFDVLIWLLYDPHYVIQEAWRWDAADYRSICGPLVHVRPQHMRQGTPMMFGHINQRATF
ncbi:hypothetical protein U0030_01035 [Brevundimonas bullata]|uniref:hypothetical protein n=1 Tax=Brevundimonas TaxID=41275 RepID=UPI000DB5A073|nr:MULTISPECIES: hypothetical protein [Brevundimonas]PZT95397.1 MAG: hypothetical protein DI624_13560 [Brevundimonas sp.]WQE37084.1 hypothetical protein U0030_01035 [Brevundimonas bullata]